MISFWRIFWLECVTLVRTGTLAMLAVAAAAWMIAFPHFAKGDGTPEGLRELTIHFSLGGVFALLVVALLASAAGSIARERAAKRLQLTLVRPVRFAAVALGKIAAHVAVGAVVLAFACAMLAASTDLRTPCRHVLSPTLPSPREEAKAMYAAYMADTNTPVEVRRAKRSVVLRLLENRAIDHYQTILTNSCAEWKFGGLGSLEGIKGLSVRMRFTNQLEMRQEVQGVFRLGGLEGVVSNITQAVLTVPLSGTGKAAERLTFENNGQNALMLRPRRDLNLLVPADSFGRNLLRTFVTLVSVLALVVSFGVLLSSGLGRPVALFVAFVTLIVGEMSPSVIEQYPDELETNLTDRIGLAITRVAVHVTRPVSALSPLGALSRDECVEPRETWQLAVTDLLVLPILLSLVSGFVIPRKQDDMA
ncbi:MAG: hypothetical protein IKF72_00210 [Kiritimatiellae bacterium]|nr:hypothetical protein [Kiritimatiellia bacterium]